MGKGRQGVRHALTAGWLAAGASGWGGGGCPRWDALSREGRRGTVVDSAWPCAPVRLNAYGCAHEAAGCNSLPQARNEKCEELRLELDAKRREASAMAGEEGSKGESNLVVGKASLVCPL